MTRLYAVLIIVLLLAPGHIRADAQISDWVGEYSMNHDGHAGTLRIADTKRDCASPAWCHLAMTYVDANGARLPVILRVLDQAFQHMVFYIDFPGNRQRFDGYLMSWDRGRMAGTTVWQGKTFGFYAFKQEPVRVVLDPAGRGIRPIPVRPATGQPASPAPTTVTGGSRTITADGSVQTTMADGRKKLTRPGQCGYTIINPDGSQSRAMCNQVNPVTPPFPDPVSGQWLDGHSEYLLEIIRALVDQASVDNYLRNESAQLTIYDKISRRTDLIAKLSEPL